MLKRAIPFILTFAFGLIIASFFVNIMPSFEFKRGKKRCKKANQELRLENDRLRQENSRLKMEKMNAEEFYAVPPPIQTEPRSR